MKRQILGVAVAAIVFYMWGFLYWGMGPYRTMVWKRVKDNAAAGKALREHFPENGTYFVPSSVEDAQQLGELFRAGPVAMVHMIAVGGRPMMDPSIMILGFALNLLGIILLAVLLSRFSTALPTYGERLKLVALIGLTATLLIDAGDVVWWQLDWRWKLYQGVYDFSFWIINGAILAKFIPTTAPRPLEQRT